MKPGKEPDAARQTLLATPVIDVPPSIWYIVIASTALIMFRWLSIDTVWRDVTTAKNWLSSRVISKFTKQCIDELIFHFSSNVILIIKCISLKAESAQNQTIFAKV